MADFVWPDDLQPYAMSFYLQHHTTVFESPFTRQQQVLGRSTPRWVARLSFRGGAGGQLRHQHDVGARLDALLMQIRGPQKTVALYDFRRADRGGEVLTFDDYAAGVPETFFDDNTDFDDGTGFVVTPVGPPSNGTIAAGATTVNLTGYEPGSKPSLVGDYLDIGDGTPHIITEANAADLYGNLTISFEMPAKTPFSGTIAFERVRGTFRLISDDAGSNPTDVEGLSTHELEFIEVLI